jgi:hypothetical protein
MRLDWDRRDWLAVVDERLDHQESGRCRSDPIASGRFRVLLETLNESRTGDQTQYGLERDVPEDVTLGEALVWAREHAVAVQVRLAGGDSPDLYSAGEMRLDLPVLPEGFAVSPRRAAEWGFIDRTLDDEPIRWDVMLEVEHDPFTTKHEWYAASASARSRWWSALDGLPDCDPIELKDEVSAPVIARNTPGAMTWFLPPAPIAVVRVIGRTRDEATEAAIGVATKAAESVGWDATRFWAEDAYPTGSKPGRWNAHL